MTKRKSATGIDLGGKKDAATCCNGEKLSGRGYLGMEEKLGKAQRAGKVSPALE